LSPQVGNVSPDEFAYLALERCCRHLIDVSQPFR
jgi:hypothetical protein